ncbi:hypothetical protein [Microbispora sp. NPDC046933]|uniref:hypothetical protein n=1 Tax=Microbispora sp. NPDC046933 TaxID=3155618 RepID=UPI0033E49AF8
MLIEDERLARRQPYADGGIPQHPVESAQRRPLFGGDRSMEQQAPGIAESPFAVIGNRLVDICALFGAVGTCAGQYGPPLSFPPDVS